MKKIIILFSICFAFAVLCALSNKLIAQCTLHDSLATINLSAFLNKPIDSLLLKLPQSYDTLQVGPAATVSQGAHLIIGYGGNYPHSDFIITICPNTRNYITVLNSQNLPFEQAWPLVLLRKERIGSIEIMGPNGDIINSAGL